MKYAIVLAAGKGTRMQSSINKVMHPILHKPMIGHVVDNLEKAEADTIIVVAGYQRDEIESYLKDRVEVVIQDEQIGTGDAVSKVTQLQGKKGSTLIVFGDCGLIQEETIRHIYEAHEGNDLTIVSTRMADPGKYSRIVRNNQGAVSKIVDYRDLSDTDQSNNEINLGIYCVNNELLYRYLPEIQDKPGSEEINIIDLVKVMKDNDHKVQVLRVEDHMEFIGVNDRIQLNLANQWLQQRVNQKHLEQGVTIMDPNSTYIGTEVVIAQDSIIYPNVHIYGNTTLGKGVEVLPNSWIENAVIGDFSKINQSQITDSTIGAFVTVGPFAHLRMHTEVADRVRIGNFVEFKNTKFGERSASAHLTYLGDAEVGKRVNIGCGVITVNYDGKKKSRTIIGDNAFIGSNSNLVAPLEVGDTVLVAAGSTVVEDVKSGDMVIARSRQEVKEGYGKKFIKIKEDK